MTKALSLMWGLQISNVVRADAVRLFVSSSERIRSYGG